MRPKALCVILLLAAGKFFAQYAKIPTDTNHFWRQQSECHFEYQIRYYKDTLTGKGFHYGKYSLFGATTGTLCSPSFLRTGYLRQDTIAKKVFILDSAFNEHPLYDFSKVAGDTLLMYDQATKSDLTYSVQSVLAGGQTLIRNGYTYIIAEGVGSLIGGLYGCQQSYPPISTENLVCFGTINPYQVQEGPEVGFEGDCYLVTGIRSNSLNDQVSRVYPNPSNGMFCVEFKNGYVEEWNYKVYDVLGREAKVSYQQMANGRSTTLDLSDLPKGVYILNVLEGRSIIHTQKVVRN